MTVTVLTGIKNRTAECKCGAVLSYAPEDVSRANANYMTKVGGGMQQGRVIARARRFIRCPSCSDRVEVQ